MALGAGNEKRKKREKWIEAKKPPYSRRESRGLFVGKNGGVGIMAACFADFIVFHVVFGLVIEESLKYCANTELLFLY